MIDAEPRADDGIVFTPEESVMFMEAFSPLERIQTYHKLLARCQRAEARLAEVVAERDRLRETAGDALRTLIVVRAEFSVKDAIGILKAALEGMPGQPEGKAES